MSPDLKKYKTEILFDDSGDYLRCKGKRWDKGKHYSNKRICSNPSVKRCSQCGIPLCNKCDSTPDRHKQNCKGVSN